GWVGGCSPGDYAAFKFPPIPRHDRGQIAYSLRTRSASVAASRAARAAQQLDEYWFHLRVKDRDLPGKHLLRLQSATPSAPSVETAVHTGAAVKLSEAVGIYLRVKGRNRGGAFQRTTERSCGYVIDICGDKDLLAYTKGDATRFRDVLIERGLTGSSIAHLRINGEEVVELDYGQVMPRLVYALAGKVPSMDDLYAIPCFEEHRPGIKKVASSMLFVEAPISRFPQDTRHLFPKSVKIGDVTEAIMAAHPEIADSFFNGIGHRCQFLESEILVEVLLVLKGMGIVALPIHDAILVPASAAAQAKAVMLEVFKKRTGQEGVVDLITKDQLEASDEAEDEAVVEAEEELLLAA
ncbi:DUF6538 domain-containing protein, partial [Rhodovulum strictum]